MEIMNFIFKHPQIKEDYLFRDKIINKLIKNKDKKLILLRAPFGYGKTVALSMFYEEIHDKKLWINCPSYLFEFDDFLNHLIYGLKAYCWITNFCSLKIYISYFNEEEKSCRAIE
jgi:LuxR family maltose regulon positive regulatory protein